MAASNTGFVRTLVLMAPRFIRFIMKQVTQELHGTVEIAFRKVNGLKFHKAFTVKQQFHHTGYVK
jgi:hypothetical protein